MRRVIVIVVLFATLLALSVCVSAEAQQQETNTGTRVTTMSFGSGGGHADRRLCNNHSWDVEMRVTVLEANRSLFNLKVKVRGSGGYYLVGYLHRSGDTVRLGVFEPTACIVLRFTTKAPGYYQVHLVA